MRIRIERFSDEKLTRRLFEFTMWFDYSTRGISLDCYSFCARKTRRHGWRCSDRWEAMDARNSTMSDPPELPQDVINELRERINEIILNTSITAGHPRRSKEIGKFSDG